MRETTSKHRINRTYMSIASVKAANRETKKKHRRVKNMAARHRYSSQLQKLNSIISTCYNSAEAFLANPA